MYKNKCPWKLTKKFKFAHQRNACTLFTSFKKKKFPSLRQVWKSSCGRYPIQQFVNKDAGLPRQPHSSHRADLASDQSRNRTEYSIVRKGPCSKARWREFPSRSTKSSASREDQCGTKLCHSTGCRMSSLQAATTYPPFRCILAKGCVTCQPAEHPQGTKFFWAAQWLFQSLLALFLVAKRRFPKMKS